MSDESCNAPSEHSDDSFDIFPDDASTDHLVQVPTPNDMDRVVDKLSEVLSGTTKVLSQNQVVIGNLAQVLEFVVKDRRENEKQVEVLTKDNDARDRRMAEPTDDLGRKCAAADSLEKAVQDARYEISLLKVGEQEKVRKIAALEKKVQELEELQSAGNREIDELYTIVDDERAKVETVEELVKDLSRKCAAVDTLEKDVEDAEYEIDLLKDSEQEANRQVAEMSKKIQELEKLHAAVKRDRDREIDELETIVEDERAKVEALEESVKAKDQQLEALAQKVQKLITLREKNAYEKNCCRAGDAPALVVGEGQYKKKNHKKSKKQAETEHSKKIAQTVCGRTVSLLTYDWHYLCGNYGDAPVTITGRGAKKDSVRFTVENAGNGEVALKSCGRYLSILKDGSVTCVPRTRDKWCHFEWIEHATGEVSLRGTNGKYVSSVHGGTSMTCTRAEAGPEERFIVM